MLHPSPGLEPILPSYIDSTMLSCFRSCPQKFYLEFVLGLRPSEVSIDLHCGGAFSHTIETFYKQFYTDQSLAGLTPTERTNAAKLQAFHAFNQYWGEVEAPIGHAKTKDNTWLAFEEYLKTFPPLTDHVQPYFVSGQPTFEFTFAVPLTPIGQQDDGHCFPAHPITGDPFLYAGRYDMVGTYNSAACIRDEKTTGQAGQRWAEQWDLRGQFIGYTWASRVSGLDVKWTVVRGIVIQKTSIRCLEAIKSYPEHVVLLWHEQLRRDLWRLRRAWDSGWFDYNLAESCNAYGGCMFKNACLSATPDSWLEGFIQRRWNPLQKDPIGEPQKEAA